MDGLPELPLEQILGELSLVDRLKSRAVSRAWYHRIDSFKVKTLCFSDRPIDFYQKSRWVNAENFVSSTRFASFFNTFGQTTLCNLRHLRLYDLGLDKESLATFVPTIESFTQLEELDLIMLHSRFSYPKKMEVELKLSMLHRLHLDNVTIIDKLTLRAPKLKRIKLSSCCDLRVDFVHGESVERLLIDRLSYTEVKRLKNLQYFHLHYCSETDLTFLSGLKQLKEFHLNIKENRQVILDLFEQKQRYGLAQLNIYLSGMPLSGPDDRVIGYHFLDENNFRCLTENLSRVADEIPFFDAVVYHTIEGVDPNLLVEILKRFTDLDYIRVTTSVRNVDRFLDLMKSLNRIGITSLTFMKDPPQQLVDRLPELPAVQRLIFIGIPSNFRFLFRFKNPFHLRLGYLINIETVRKLFEKPHLLSLRFGNKSISTDHSKRFKVSVNHQKWTEVTDLNAAIQFLDNARKREMCPKKTPQVKGTKKRNQKQKV